MRRRNCVIPLLFKQIDQATTVRNATPIGISPVVTIRHISATDVLALFRLDQDRGES
jgi:hypothetical protein